MRGNPCGALHVRRCPNTRTRTRAPQRRYVGQRVRLHQPVNQAGLGGSFSYFFYGRCKRSFMRGYAVNPTQYYCTNSAGAITIGVGLQNVSTVNCIYGCVTNGVTQNLGNLGHP